MDESGLRGIIENYFHQGYENRVIIDFLSEQHGIVLSLATLKRRLSEYGLRRRGTSVDDQQIRNVIQQITSGPGELQGYRSVWHSLRVEHHIHVSRQRVADILREVNPQGTQQRRRRRLTRRRFSSCGPNFSWHIDGYDKLKPFGFPIHGAIDGYSRKVLWLKVARSNNKPEVIGSFFLGCVRECSGCPILLRTDCGTENGVAAAMQSYFRQESTDEFAGEKSHRYGTSPANQRIECWWSSLRRGRTSWWIDHFHSMVNSGLLDTDNEVHKECLWFCYQQILQEELDRVKHHWNTHRIRPSRYGTIPGIPNVLYHLPHRSNGIECKVFIPPDKINAMQIYAQNDDEDDDDESALYQEYFDYVMQNEMLQYPSTPDEAFNLFKTLIDIANS